MLLALPLVLAGCVVAVSGHGNGRPAHHALARRDGLMGLRGHGNAGGLVARQQTTQSASEMDAGFEALPAQCKQACAPYEEAATKCYTDNASLVSTPSPTTSLSDTQDDTQAEAAILGCVCNKQTFDAITTCAQCFPSYFAGVQGGYQASMQEALDECAQAGHSVDGVTAAGLAAAVSSGASSAGSATGTSASGSSSGSTTSRPSSGSGSSTGSSTASAASTSTTSGATLGIAQGFTAAGIAMAISLLVAAVQG